ncbi:MAG: hypothetical protein RL318_1820 [Fibrobacterota bacterium]
MGFFIIYFTGDSRLAPPIRFRKPMMKYSAALLACLPFLLGLGACDKAVDPAPKTDTTATPTATAWTATVSLNSLQLTTAQLNATSSIQATATQGSSAVSTKSLASVSDITTLSIPSGEACIVTVNGYDASKTVIWTGSVAIAKSLPAAVITLNSVGGTIVTPGGDETPISYRSVQQAGAQSASPGSYISVRGDEIDPNGFILTAGDKTPAEEAVLDLVFFAMTNGVKDAANGTPTFMSPNSIKSMLSWSTTNKTIIVKATGTEASYATVQSVKDAIGSSTSESAPVVSGGVYALQLSNGKYGVLSVTSLAGKNGAAVVTFRILNSGAASTSGGSTGGGNGGGITDPTGDQTTISYQSTQQAGAQQATAGSNISVRGDILDPGGFVLTSGEKTASEEAAMDLLFTAMSGNVQSASGTPSFVSPSLLKSSLGWATTNQTLIVSLPLASISDFSTVQDIKDAFVANQSSVSYSAAVVQGGIYALWLSNDDYAVLHVTSLTGANGKASVSFKIYK